MAYRHLDRIHDEWRLRGSEIRRRLRDFRAIRSAPDEMLFRELSFCLMAIQTSAHRADDAVRAMDDSGLLWKGTERSLARFLRSRVRFHNNKAAYVVAARSQFIEDGRSIRRMLTARASSIERRERLVREVNGLGYKEASHFLRNVGRGEDLAILDRHILRNLRYHGVIRSMPETLTRRRYLEIEDQMRRFSGTVKIPLAGMDLLFWSRETGEVFK